MEPAASSDAQPEDEGRPPPGGRERIRELAARLDRQSGLLAVARRLRGHLPGDPRFGDPLSTGGDGAFGTVARGFSALTPARESVVRELGFTGLQLWQSLSERTGRGRGETAMALLFTDVVGFSAWALRAGDHDALVLLRALDRVHRTAIAAEGGMIAARLGDGMLARFATVEQALAAAFALQRAAASIEVGGHRPRLRAGVHWGRPRRLGGKLLGVDVTIAEAVAGAAGAGEVLLSETALQLLPSDVATVGRPRRLRAAGTPPGTAVRRAVPREP